MMRKLHHNACRCRHWQQKRACCKGLLGLPLPETLPIQESRAGRATPARYIALEVGAAGLQPMRVKRAAQGIETPDRSGHGMIDSIYLRGPNGDVIELRAKPAEREAMLHPRRHSARHSARDRLPRCAANKPATSA